ncbi:unnamed protein product [Cylindrotheca closterium]|uniref:FAS1 domain-containing protein n=1 Tax=Cylindrotheca closterium TaxID=2856 RepID=A0AAD2JMM6_9STRA|nr:unnamed protein product [Cylindrotheca closterium]
MKLLSLFLSTLIAATSGQVTPPTTSKTTPISYQDGDAALLGHLAVPEGNGTYPAIVIIPDWDGVNEYEQIRATYVMEQWGMVAFAADIYGEDFQTVPNITERRDLANFYRSNPDVFGSRISTAIQYVKDLPSVDETMVSVFGYCFGGTGILQYVLGEHGDQDVASMVSFHGGLSFLPENATGLATKLLVLDGGADHPASSIMDLEMRLDASPASWEITRYAGIEHAFTVWEDARYDEWADMRSWEAAGEFVLTAIGVDPPMSAQPDMITTTPVEYMDNMTNLTGHLAMPSAEWMRPLPAVIILPDWDGVNTYEQERATALAELGYVAMAADMFGSDKQFVEAIPDRIAETGKFGDDPTLFVTRVQAAIEQIKMLGDEVDTNEIAIIGYCFGGTATVTYSMLNGTDVKVAVAFHGSFGGGIVPPQVNPVIPYQLILSGGDDGLHGNQTIMESTFDEGAASWEITRYSGVDHGYTAFASGAYNLEADARSWKSMLNSFNELLAVPQMMEEDPSFIDQVAMTGNYTTLLTLVSDPAIQETLAGAGPITVFGPNDAAFADIASTVEELSPMELQGVLAGHVVSGVYTAAMVKEQGCVMLQPLVGSPIRAMYVEDDCRRRLAGHEMPVDDGCRRNLAGHEMPTDPCCRRRLAGHIMDDSSTGHVMINDAMVILADVADDTSIFHGLDKVLQGGDFECPDMTTDAPVAAPTGDAPTTDAPVAAPTGDAPTTDETESSASGLSVVLAAVVALFALAF